MKPFIKMSWSIPDHVVSLFLPSRMIIIAESRMFEFFQDGGPYHIKTSPLIYKTGFYMLGTSVMKELEKTDKMAGLLNYTSVLVFILFRSFKVQPLSKSGA